MKLQIMDHTGHSTLEFDKASPVALAEAQAIFEKCLADGGAGFEKHEPDEKGSTGTRLKAFNPEAEEILLRPQLVGG